MLANKALSAAPSAVPVYIEDTFSSYLYTGNGSTQTITNGIDLSGKGGLVWSKARSDVDNNRLYDTARGTNTVLISNSTSAQLTDSNTVTAFNSNGYSIGSSGNVNLNGTTFASWTFAKQAKFFDIVTYTGNGAASRSISHSLGSIPGFVAIKCTSTTGDWRCAARNNGGNYYNGSDDSTPFGFNSTNRGFTSNLVGSGALTSTTFDPVEIGFAGANTNGATYVAYLFAHNAGGFGTAGTDNVISCGSFTSDGSGNATVTLNYEPQFILFKKSNATGGWILLDNMRGWANSTSGDPYLAANSSAAEDSSFDFGNPTATGFTLKNLDTTVKDYIYIAIRRGPMKTPTSGTSVFYPQAVAQADSPDSSNVPFPPDLVNTFSRNGTDRISYNLFQFVDRLRGLGIPNNSYSASGPQLISSSTAAEDATSNSSYVQLKSDGINITRSTGWNSSSYGNWIYYFFRRAPGFFDVVCYTGDGAATRTVNHNLGVAPELLIAKKRATTTQSWFVYLPSGNTRLTLNSNGASPTYGGAFSGTTPTATTFSFDSDINGSGDTYVTYLFATVANVSKVGSYTGNGSNQTINCGFTAGARFILIKRTDSTGNWVTFDTARGIVAGNDPALSLNITAAEETAYDVIDPDNSGFIVNQETVFNLNVNNGSYIYLAIA